MKFIFLLLVAVSVNLGAATYDNCPNLPVDSDDLSMEGIDLDIRFYNNGERGGAWWTTGYGSEVTTPDFKTYTLYKSKPVIVLPYSDQGGKFQDKVVAKCEVIDGIKTITAEGSGYNLKIYEIEEPNCSMLEIKKGNVMMQTIRLCP